MCQCDRSNLPQFYGLSVIDDGTSSNVITLENQSTAIATVGQDPTNTFYLLNNTQTGSPCAITLTQGDLSLGETDKTVSITGNLLDPNKVCLDASSYRYIYERNNKVYIGNTTNVAVFSIDYSDNVIDKGSITANSTP